MRTSAASTDAMTSGAPLLVADDDPEVRTLLATLFRAAAGVASVLEAADGAEAVELARERRVDVAVLDLNMPRLDGIETALRLRALQPSLRIALHSADPEPWRQRAARLNLPVFDKIDFDRLLAWVERQAAEVPESNADTPFAPMAPKLDLCCDLCGYGIVNRLPPSRCPMCGGETVWSEPLGWTSRRAALHQRRAG